MPKRKRPARAKAPKPPARPKENIDSVELIVPSGMWGQIHDYLFADLTKEYACYLLCGHSRRSRTQRLLGCYLVLPEPDEYVSHSLASVELRRSLLATILGECERLGLSLIDIHSHPFAGDQVGFSATDEADEQEKAAWFSKHLPASFFGSIVLGRSSYEARIRSAAGGVVSRPLHIRRIDSPLEQRNAMLNGGSPLSEAFDRHVRAFGQAGQQRLSGAHFGIIGLGGLGSGIAVGL